MPELQQSCSIFFIYTAQTLRAHTHTHITQKTPHIHRVAKTVSQMINKNKSENMLVEEKPAHHRH